MNYKNQLKIFLLMLLSVTIHRFNASYSEPSIGQLAFSYYRITGRSLAMDTAINAFGRMIFPDGLGLTKWDVIKMMYHPKAYFDPNVPIKQKLGVFSFAYGIPALSIWAAYRASKAVYQSEKGISWREKFWKWYNKDTK